MITLPPIFFYAIGTLLVVFGALRSIILGRRRADREVPEDTPERAQARRRHLVMGLIWVLSWFGQCCFTAWWLPPPMPPGSAICTWRGCLPVAPATRGTIR